MVARVLRLEAGETLKLDEQLTRIVITNVSLASSSAADSVGILSVVHASAGSFPVCKLRKRAGARHAKFDLHLKNGADEVSLRNAGDAALDVAGHLEPPEGDSGLRRRPKQQRQQRPASAGAAGTSTAEAQATATATKASSASASASTPESTARRAASKQVAESTDQSLAKGGKRPRAGSGAKQDWNLTFVEASGERLERHAGAQRDARPAWMTKGVGIGIAMFGERGIGDEELLKPGLTRAALARLEARTADGDADGGGAAAAANAADPFAEVFAESCGVKSSAAAGAEAAAQQEGQRRSWRQSEPLPPQDSTMTGGRGASGGRGGRGGGGGGGRGWVRGRGWR
eukprot:TRINITY_DN71153_c0_g1_i1.p1 TRINITY_DN71153_c0_g1~~TRINITY_DN71153_c0_g1_i1.p1  ORF type:complete len:345 (+),score=112.43 TRINITY_DN71153_c0_g1_i1:59-1093(+)